MKDLLAKAAGAAAVVVIGAIILLNSATDVGIDLSPDPPVSEKFETVDETLSGNATEDDVDDATSFLMIVTSERPHLLDSDPFEILDIGYAICDEMSQARNAGMASESWIAFWFDEPGVDAQTMNDMVAVVAAVPATLCVQHYDWFQGGPA